MSKRITLPEQSLAAEAVARLINSSCVVVLSVNDASGTFETRCYGATDVDLWMAGRLSDVVIEAAAASEPPAGWEQIARTLGKPEGGKQ